MSFHSSDTSLTTIILDGSVAVSKPLTSNRQRGTVYRNLGKRAIDLILCAVALPVIILVIAVLAALIVATGQRPFYSQTRVGRQGKPFRMWKLQSMVPNSDVTLRSYLAEHPEARAEWRRYQKLETDPRVTGIGLVLRRTSMDELPQIWNVLKGEMSLVGPRPMLIFQQPLYHGEDYYELRPGISGNWQVSERNKGAFADRAVFDRQYNSELSLGQDLRIIWQTIGVVLRATGC